MTAELAGTLRGVLSEKADTTLSFDGEETKGNYTKTEFVSSGSYYKSNMSLYYYPGGVIRPGYKYRTRVILLKKNSSGTYDNIVSKNGTRQYALTTSAEWKQYTYSDENRLIEALVTDRTESTITCSLYRAGNSESYGTWNLLDNYYYVRLQECDANGNWTYVSNKCYTSNLLKTSIAISKTYSVTFQNLKADTQYRIVCFALADTDYDNYLNIAGSTLLEDNRSDYPIYGSTSLADANMEDTNAERVSELYNYYLGIESKAYAGQLVANNTDKLTSSGSRADEVIISRSGSISTLKAGQIATLGTLDSSEVGQNNTAVTLRFEKASGTKYLTSYDYSIYKLTNGYYDPLVSGSKTKSDTTGLLEETKYTDIAILTIKNDRMSFEDGETYYIVLDLTFENEANQTSTEKQTLTITINKEE
jgi:hypothetical protein